MNGSRLLHPSLNLDSDRQWRLMLAIVFILAVLCRFLVHMSMAGHPVGRLEEWAGTVPWHYATMAEDAVLDGNWSLGGLNLLVTQDVVRLAPPAQWEEWYGGRLPRGAPAVWLMAVSYALTNSLAIYAIASIFAGGFLAVLIAAAGARVFQSRGAGLVAGILAASQGSLVLASTIAGPWLWEALALAALLLCVLRVRDAVQNPAEWLLLGLTLGAALWLRPFFWWGVILIPVAIWRWKLPINAPRLAALAVPVLLSVALLSARNAAVNGSPVPTVGQPGWDFIETTNPTANLFEQAPVDAALLEASRGSFPGAARTMWSVGEYRSGLPQVLNRKVREFIGARDSAGSFSSDYIRRRIEMLRVMTLSPDVTMAAGWAALILLIALRRLPGPVAVVLLLLAVHALLFRTSGMERAMLHVMTSLLIAGAAAAAMRERLLRPALPLVFVALWAAMAWVLSVDDQARGTRYRANEFAFAAKAFANSGNEELARAEILDYQTLRRHETLFDEFWNAMR